MAPISVKIVMDNGAVTRTIKFDSSQEVSEVLPIVEEKMLNGASGKDYGLFLTSADDEKSGIWLEGHRNMDYYMLRDGDSLQYICKTRTMRFRMLDGSIKTMQVDESKIVEDLMLFICSKIGITNHDEYGLCREEQTTETEEQKPATGTLTLKRKAQKEEKDAILEQLSKKLKTDDNVEWLDHHRTLREMAVDPKETLLLKRRLFYSDRKVDSRDPVQLNLLYVQTRDAILEGRHPVTVDQAVEFAGIQCQIHYGDFQEEKHKPGFIENLREFLPEEYASSWGVEKKILKLYKKHTGMSQLEAKYLYTRTARELPTYGVTFFLVKEQQKNKKKLVPRLLGINSSSILRLDEVTKDILQVWPLTQVKTFHAGKTNSFTLNFGDYSDKEYSVKTNDAHRIRDILQSYIDIIRKRMMGPYNPSTTEGGIIYQDSVETSRANVMEFVSNNPSKIMEESFVGPSKIITVEPGTQVAQGTQFMTVQQIIISDKLKSQQRGVAGEVPIRSDFVRKLNRMNSNSVKIVTLLSDPHESEGKEVKVKQIVHTMEQNMPDIDTGVKEAASKQEEENRKKLLDELQELCDYMCTMANSVNSDEFNSSEAEDTAKKIANLTTQMYCSLDPKTKRRSELFAKRSRQSFVEDEKTRESLNQAAYIAAAATTLHAVDSANGTLVKEYTGPVLADPDACLDKSAAHKLDNLNAAVAMYLAAHEDPKNVGYPALTHSMQTIQHELPKLAEDVKTLSSTEDKYGQQLLDKTRELCDALRKLCMYTGAVDREKIHGCAKNYGDSSRDLLSYIFSPVGCRNPKKEKEIIELAKQAAERTSDLLTKANELEFLSQEEHGAADVDKAGAACADAARSLMTCAQITAPSIHEPHCQSALTAAAENVASSAQHLATAWKPLIKDSSRQPFADDLRSRSIDLAQALDRLKEAYSNLDGKDGNEDTEDKVKERQRLQFIMTKKLAQNNLQDAEKELDQPVATPQSAPEAEALERSLAQRMAQLNAAIASLIAATSDRENADYDTAEIAISTISKSMPGIIKDTKALSGTKDEKARQVMLDDIKALCEATRGICASAGQSEDEVQVLNNSAVKFANASGKLLFTFNPHANRQKEHEIIDLSKSACEAASQLLANAYRLASAAGGEGGARVDARGARVADAAQALLTAAQITAASAHEPRCQAALLSAVDWLSASTQQLADAWTPLVQESEHSPVGAELDKGRQEVEKAIAKLRKACEVVGGNEAVPQETEEQKRRRLKFVTTKSAAKNAVNAAEKELNKPMVGARPSGPATAVQQRPLAEKMAKLNAAIASLIAATSDCEKPDYDAAESAVATITQLMPVIVKDTKTLSATKDDKARQAMLDDIKALCEATRDICASDGQLGDEKYNEAAAKFANASGRLFYICSPNVNQQKEHEIIYLSKSTCEAASQVLARAYQLAESVGGAGGAQVDAHGARVADAAQALLTTAQITAPSVHEARCQAALLSAADGLSASAQQLTDAWTPLVQAPEHIPLGAELDKGRLELEREIEKLRKACQVTGGSAVPQETEEQKRLRLKFVTTKSAAKNAVEAAEKELNKPVVGTRGSGPAVADQQQALAEKMAKLNAAIASFIAATSCRDKPDYETAESAVATIIQLMPVVVKDTKTLSTTKDDKMRQAMLDDIKALCDATRGICVSEGQLGDEKYNEAAAKFANASGRLFYICSPNVNQQKEHEIKDLSKSTCEAASQVLARAYQLAESVGGEGGAQVDAHGARVADAAQALITTAQITAPSVHEARCKAALLSAADGLSVSAQHLADSWTPLVQTPEHRPLGAELDKRQIDLEREIGKLRKACDVAGGSEAVPQETEEQKRRRLKFITTKSAAKKAVDAVEKELNKPIVGARPSGPAIAELGRALAVKMGQLNAAIASLITATSDREKPDYEGAESAVTTITELMPGVVKDTKTLSASKDDKARQSMLDDIKALCEATRDICASEGQLGDEKYNEAAAKFANASGRLFYICSPNVNQQKEHEIIDLSKSTCEAASQVLARAYQLAESVGGGGGAQVDAQGARVADAAQALLTTAQITAPSVHEARCQAALLSAADGLSASAQQLANAWTPLVQAPEHRLLGAELDKGQHDLEREIEKLRKACAVAGDEAVPLETEELKRRRLKFFTTKSTAKNAVEAAEKELNKPIVGARPSGPATAEQQRTLAEKMAQLNAAIASLIAATSDRQKPDYEAAESAVATITQLMPLVVKDTKTLSATKDDKARQAMLDDIKALCEATRGICTNEDQLGDEKYNEAAAKFANASGRLFYICSPNVNQQKEHEIIDLSKSTCEAASQVLARAYQLAESVGGEGGAQVDAHGARVADVAQALLTTAQITAPSVHEARCKAALLSAADGLSVSAQQLADSWTPLVQTPEHRPLGAELDKSQKDLEREIGKLKKACEVAGGREAVPQETEEQMRRRLKFVTTKSVAKNAVDVAEKELNKPIVGARPSGTATAEQQRALAEKMAQLNAAIASFIAATSDRQMMNYETAESAIATITQLMPVFVKDTKTLSATKDDKARQAMLDDIKALCEATRGICASEDEIGHEKYNEAATKFANASGRLFYICSPNVNQQKEHQIIDLSKSTCEAASHLLARAYRLASAVGGESGARVDARGARVADAAQALLTAAQITAPAVHESHCQAALISAADGLSASAQQLNDAWMPLVQAPEYKPLGVELVKDQEQLNLQIQNLKAACKDSCVKGKPVVPVRRDSLKGKKNAASEEHANGVGLVSKAEASRDFNHQFLHQLRNEASHDIVSSCEDAKKREVERKLREEQKKLQQQFVQSVNSAVSKIYKAEECVKKASNSKKGKAPIKDAAEALAVHKQMENNLALASVAVSSLVACNRPDQIDYTIASMSMTVLSESVPVVAEDAMLLSGSLDEKSRKNFLENVVALCSASKALCDAAKKNREKLNVTAVEFGNSAAKLLYEISTDVDPGQEKEVIARAKLIGDNAARVSLSGATVAKALGEVDDKMPQLICNVGGRCADAAGTLVYTAKLVAPSIQHAECQESLTRASEDLSLRLKEFSKICEPLSSDPKYSNCLGELHIETANLEKLLIDLKQDLKAGKLVKKKEPQLGIENTPLRQLATTILEDAKKKAESTSLPEAERREFANYSNQIADAVRIMDVANVKCQQSPHETKKREELEEAVQNLQHILLQLRPRRGDAQKSNIVDLTDFVKEVSSTAEQMIETSNTCKSSTGKHLSGVEDVKGECHMITLNAFRLISPTQRNTDGTTEDDILQVVQFAQDCKGRVQTIQASIKRIEDEKTRNVLEDKALSLAESCHLLRFATKSALATAQSAALDETINDLNDLETKIDKMLLAGTNPGAIKYNPQSASLLWSRAQLCAATARAGGGETQNLAPALNKYVAELRTTDAVAPTHKKILAEHLNKLLKLLRTHTVSTSRRVATWQPVDESEVSTVTQQISQEFENADNVFGKGATKSSIPVLKSVDVNKLLVPNNSMQVKGDKKHLEEQVQHLATKLNSMTGTIMLSVQKPESLARSANATVDAATQLAATARALKDNNDPVQSKRIEDATHEMSFATYNLLKTSEMVSQDQHQPASRRRLLDACRALNDAINKLARTSCTNSSNKLHSECGELTRTLQMQQGVLQGTHPSCALSYADSLDALQQQHDVIQKLKDNKPMSREEFGKNLNYATSATCNSMEYAAQCAYLLSISEQHKEVAKEGLVDVGRIQTITGSLQDVCFRIMRSTHVEDAKVEEGNLNKHTQELQQAITEASTKPIHETTKHKLQEATQRVTTTANTLQVVLNKSSLKEVEIFPATINVMDAVGEVNAAVEHPSLVPKVGTGPTETQRNSEVVQISRGLITHLLALIKEVKERKSPETEDDDTMTWVMFNDRRKNVLDTFEALISKLRENGQLAGLILVPQSEAEEDDTQKKSYVQIQVDLANKWLQRPIPKSDVKATGQIAAREVVDIAEKMVEDLQGNEKEEIRHLITETDQLLGECSKKYDSEKASLLMDKLKELRKAIERLVVTRVVEDFIEEETPLEDLEILTDAERDETKRKFLLERKIAELLAQLGRVTKTARFVADSGSGSQNVTQELKSCSNQAELLAPMLVKAAQERVNAPNDQTAIENYKSLLSKYAEAISKVRELCDMSVDPLDFVQTAGDTMQRMRDESTEEKCPMKTVKVSNAIEKLVNRVFEVSMHNARSDPELQSALASARERLEEIRPKADTRASRMPDWKVTAAEILRTTGEVESVLGGEIIFKKQPEPDQPIYNAALDLHAAVREWSGRDNEIVAVAKRMAVLMAKLSEYMNSSKKREVIVTSKSIVQESHEVAHLAKKLALECTDIRIRTNLLQVCERIPTISGQLKMLTTVKGASLGHQGTEEDKEAMNMLVGNAQNLMLSVQEVIKAAASASVKINAQRTGPRMRWVRRNIYY